MTHFRYIIYVGVILYSIKSIEHVYRKVNMQLNYSVAILYLGASTFLGVYNKILVLD